MINTPDSGAQAPTTAAPLRVLGLGGTLRRRSTSERALEIALEAAEAAGATVRLLALFDLRLPFYIPGQPRLLDAVHQADAMLWSTGAYHGTLAGSTKNALDFLEFLGAPYLDRKAVGLIATAGGTMAAVNAINTMVQVAHSLRATLVSLTVPIPTSRQMFDERGNLVDASSRERLEQVGRLVVELAERFRQGENIAV